MSRHNPVRAEAAVQQIDRRRLWPLGADLRSDLRPAVPSRTSGRRAGGGRGGGRERRIAGRRRRHRPGARIAAQERARDRHRSQRADAQDRARAGRAARAGTGQVVAGDGRGALTFEPDRFDVALAPYVMSVVPEPRRVLDEMWRVVRPGGQIVVMNHFAARARHRARGSRR